MKLTELAVTAAQISNLITDITGLIDPNPGFFISVISTQSEGLITQRTNSLLAGLLKKQIMCMNNYKIFATFSSVLVGNTIL